MAKTETQAGKTANIGFPEHAGRILITGILTPIIGRTEKTDDENGINKAKEALGKGHGVIVLINHFSLKDPCLAVNEIFRHTEMGSKRIVAPIASHIDRPVTHNFLRLIGLDMKPIVTENTVKEGKNNGRELFEGKGEYLKASLSMLRQGGIVILAPQGSRQEHLGQPERPNVATLIVAAKRTKPEIVDFSFLFIGFGIKGVDDYSASDVRGFNPFKTYSVNIGACLTKEELMEKAGGDLRTVDRVVYEELGKLVPNNYR